MDQSNGPNFYNDTEAGNSGTQEDSIEPPNETSSIQIPTSSAPISFNLTTANTSYQSVDNKPISSVTLMIRPSLQSSLASQRLGNITTPMSSVSPGAPPSLFIQALSKLNESSLSSVVLSRLKSAQLRNNGQLKFGEITPPDSLANAPPSYSFVLRQMAARRRPRLMGTFIPSPSFVQHTPPPNYAMAFDIYVDNPTPAPPPRVYPFGYTSMPAVCPECGYTGMTVVTTKITMCTHMCAFLLCLFCCWICVPLPYILRSCKDVYHHCRSCRNFLGVYCPTNIENP